MSLATRVWDTLMARETAQHLCDGEPIDIIETERLTEDKMIRLVEWLATKAASL